MQELRPLINAPRTHRTERTTATINGDRRGAKAKTTTRIPKVVAQQQEKIA